MATGSGGYSNSDASAQKAVKTNKTQLSTPVVTLNGVSDTGLTVNWNRIANASGYEIHYSKASGFAIGSGGVTKVTVNSGSLQQAKM